MTPRRRPCRSEAELSNRQLVRVRLDRATEKMEVPMRKVISSTFVTLDGVIDGKGKADIGSWQPQFWNDEMDRYHHDLLFASDALLMGRVTYQGFAEYWPTATDETGDADRINSLPKYVASTTLQEPLAWNATLLQEDVAEAVAKLKCEPGQDILMFGCGDLAHTLLQHGLIDELRLWVNPVVVGDGVRLFKDPADPAVLRLAETRTFSSGVVVLTYTPAGTHGEGAG
jgi:dihydrofolate reductase